MSFLFLIVFVCGLLLRVGESIKPRCSPSESNPTTKDIEENKPVGNTVFTYTGYDGDGDRIRFLLLDDTSPFSISAPGSGDVDVAEPLDFEKKTQYTLDKIYVTEFGKNPLQYGNKCGTLTVNVLPVNEFTPVIEHFPQKVTLSENLPENQFVATLNCTDEDKELIGNPDGCSSISIQAGDDMIPKFAIINNTIVTTANLIDYDTGDVIYKIIIIGVDYSTLDPRKTGTTTITINIEPVNEFTPSILGQPLEISIPENKLVGTDIFKVSATDDDAGPHGEVTYKIVGGDGTFLISQTTGRIYLRRPVDFESTQKSSYYVTVEASDGEFSSTALVNVTVTDVNDNIPVCRPTENNVTIDESRSVGSTILSVTCTDDDAATILTYQILSGDHGQFTISAQGDIIVANDLDYDSGLTSYYMHIEVSDGVHNTKAWVLVQLSPINEFPPVATSHTVNVSEIAPIGSEIITYLAGDKDAPPHDVTSYQIINVNGKPDTFYIEKQTGKIYLASFLDYEIIPQYRMVIKVKDIGGKTATGTVTVNVDNENDHAPSCKQSTKIISVLETAAVGMVVMSDFECTDLDNNPLSYSLNQSPNDGVFEIDPVNKQIKLKGPLDYETTPFYSVVIRVSDGSIFTKMTLAVNVIDENESIPQFIDKVVMSTISESDRTGTQVAVVSATDEENHPLIYSFVESYAEFMIDPKSGIIRLRTQVDRERAPTLDILVEASDGQFTSTATVSVTIEDVNEMPLFQNSNYEFSVEENKSTGTTVGKVSAEDPDMEDPNGKVQYKIVKGNENSHYNIDANTGIITLTSPLDYESQRTELLLVEAFDLGSPSLSNMCTVTIKILDKNDDVPTFLSLKLKERVSEDTPVGQILTQVYAYDKDSSVDNNNMVVYKSTSNVPFTVESLSGFVRVSNNLDREKAERYEMLITATDNGSPQLTGTLTLEIDITDVNDNDPTVRGTYIATVPENVPLHYIVFSIDAYDADGEAFGKLRYEIVSPDMNSVFKIEENTGTLQTASSLDRESRDIYEVLIKVSDNGTPPRSTTVSATIYVTDVNDVAPKPARPSYDFSVPEMVGINTNVGKISVTDDDLGINSKLAFFIATYWKGSGSHFKVNQDDGEVLTTGILDRELEDKYSFLVRIQDGGTPSLSTDVTVNIKLTDINDNAPVFKRPFYSTAIFENLTTGINFLSVGASDYDLGINSIITYEIDTSSDDNLRANLYFGVHGTTGNIFLRRKVDREVYRRFTLTIIAKDSGVPSLSSEVNVNIQIEDVNDNAPVLSPLFYNTEASSVNLCDAVITTVRATDADVGRNAAINYYINENDDKSPFIVSNLGVIKAMADLLHPKYIININGRDNGDPQLWSRDPALVRIDKFDPDRTVITFSFGLLLSDYLNKELDLLDQVGKALNKVYPTAYVRRWCTEAKYTSVLVYWYAVKNDETNDVNNLQKEKVFVTNGEFLDVLQLDQNKRPTVDVDGQRWENYAVVKVTQYGADVVYPEPAVSSLTDSSSDLALPLGVSLPLLVLVAIATMIVLYFAWRRRWCQKKENNSQSNLEKENPLVSNKDGPIDPLTRKISGPFIPTFSDKPQETWSTKEHQSWSTRESSPVNRKSNQPTGTMTPPDASNSNTVQNEHGTKQRGIEIVTGWMFEEDPVTKVKNWIR